MYTYFYIIHIYTFIYIYIYTLYTHAYCIYVRNVFILYITCRIKIQEIYRRFRFPVLFFYFIAFPNMCNGLAHILHLKATLLPKVGPGQRTFHFQWCRSTTFSDLRVFDIVFVGFWHWFVFFAGRVGSFGLRYACFVAQITQCQKLHPQKRLSQTICQTRGGHSRFLVTSLGGVRSFVKFNLVLQDKTAPKITKNLQDLEVPAIYIYIYTYK